MNGYLSVLGRDSGSIRVESRTEIYRSSGDTEEILVETGGRTVSIGVSDVTVSRKKDGQAPVVIEPSEEFVGIRNAGNTNGVTVRTQDDELEVDEGHLVNVTRDAELSLGFNTEFRLVVERQARVEQHVVNEGEGDVVLGDQRNVDNSTNVGDDNVINRTDIGGDEPAEVGSDNVVNRSSVGDSNGTDAPGGETTCDDATQFCTECGTELPVEAVACFACGTSLDPDGGVQSGDTRQFCERHQQTYTGETCPACRSEQ